MLYDNDKVCIHGTLDYNSNILPSFWIGLPYIVLGLGGALNIRWAVDTLELLCLQTQQEGYHKEKTGKKGAWPSY